MAEQLNFKELTPTTFNDFKQLFGNNGACGGCWCMYWRSKNKDFETDKGNGNFQKIKKLVGEGRQIGLIAYLGNEPIGWCAFAPREDFIRLKSSKILKPVDEKNVWSITCFFIKRKFRRRGYSVKLLKEVIKFAEEKNVKIIEGYPVEPKQDKMGDAFVWTGLASAYVKAGFIEVARRSETRPIMRYSL